MGQPQFTHNSPRTAIAFRAARAESRRASRAIGDTKRLSNDTSQVAPAASRLSIGIIGAGKIVEDAHLPTLLNIPDVEVRWICDLSASRAALLSSMYGVPAISLPAVEAGLREIDVCLLAVPVGARRAHMEACARAGVAVYAEKPFARDIAEHREYAGLFPPHRVGVGFQRRFYQSTFGVRTVIQSGVLGPLRAVDFAYGAYSLKTGGSASYLVDSSLSGGGMIIESAIHGLDQILFATGADSVTVASARSVVLGGSDFDTITDATIDVGGSEIPVRCEITRLRNVNSGTDFHFDHATVRQGPSAEADLVMSGRNADPTERFTLLPRVPGPQRGARTVAEALLLVWEEFLTGLRDERVNAASAMTSELTTMWVDQIHARLAK